MKVLVVVAAGVAGLLVGALAGVGLAGDVSVTSPVVATLDSVHLPQVGVGGSFEIHPAGLEIERPGSVAFSFDLFTTAPEPEAWSGSRFTPPAEVRIEEVPVVVPLGWTLLTDRGEIPGGDVNPAARRALFTVPNDLVVDEIRGVRLDGYSLGLPFEQLASIPLDGPIGGIVPGVELSAAVTDFGQDWLVEFAVVSTDGVQAASLGVIGLPELGGNQYGGSDTQGWRATYSKSLYPEVPDPLPVLVSGLRWVEVDDRILISVDEL